MSRDQTKNQTVPIGLQVIAHLQRDKGNLGALGVLAVGYGSLGSLQGNPNDHPDRRALIIPPEEHEFLHPGEVPRLFRIGS